MNPEYKLPFTSLACSMNLRMSAWLQMVRQSRGDERNKGVREQPQEP